MRRDAKVPGISALARAGAAGPEMITHTHIDGLISLLKSYTKEREEPRYYGYQPNYAEVRIEGKDNLKSYDSVENAMEIAILETKTLYPDMQIDDTYYYFTGEKMHAITHAHAIFELSNLGFDDLAIAACEAH